MKAKIILWIGALLLLTAGAGCETYVKDSWVLEKEASEVLKNAPPVEAFTYFGCKKSTNTATVSTKSASEEEEYIAYEGYKDGYLYIRHINATFNCCPDTLKVTASTSGDRLFINEQEINPQCNCTCQYDLTYKIGPLSAQKYTLHLYKDALQYTEFSFTYNTSLKSQFIIKKNNAL